MENTEIIQKARAKAEMWLNDAYDKATRTEVERPVEPVTRPN